MVGKIMVNRVPLLFKIQYVIGRRRERNQGRYQPNDL